MAAQSRSVAIQMLCAARGSTVSGLTISGGFAFLGKMAMPKRWKLLIITGLMNQSQQKLNPIHPGEILLEEFLKPMQISQNRLALDIGVPPRRINEIVLGKRSITADTALRLGRYFNMSAEFWLGLQMDYDLDLARDALAERLQREVRC